MARGIVIAPTSLILLSGLQAAKLMQTFAHSHSHKQSLHVKIFFTCKCRLFSANSLAYSTLPPQPNHQVSHHLHHTCLPERGHPD
ncbi:hypothetical protein CC79DRAFT_1335299 [Sarocladium strictum]